MTTPEPALEWPDPQSGTPKTDRKRLAGLFVEVAKCLNRDLATQVPSDGALDPRLKDLRRMLLGREQDILARLQHQVDDREQFAAGVSQVLAAAITQAAARDAQLNQALTPTIEDATQLSIKKNPRTLVNILYPLMGPAIRKSIGEALAGMVQSLNEALKHSFSWRGLKWRLEAYRTGTPFAEIVLKHTLIYRVEHVFLIHKHNGLLLLHVAVEQAVAKDPELVSAMLSAIQDFVRDSFSETGNERLDTLRLGELLVWCEEGPYAFLVAVIRGNPPERLHELLRDTLVEIHHQRHEALESFDGDATAFLDIRDLLADCLRSQEQTRGKKTSSLHWLFYLLPVALLLFAGYWFYQRYQDNRAWAHYLERLQAQPGIVVTGFERRNGRWYVTGLRDPLAADPKDLLSDSTLAWAQISGHWEPYQALHPALVVKRIRASLDPVPTVSFTLEHDTVRAHGSAPHVWLQKAHALIRSLPPGSPAFDLSGVKDAEMPEFERLRDAIESRLIHFDHNVPKPAPGQEAQIEAVAAELRELAKLTRRFGLPVRVTVIGHADLTGKDTPNLTLSMGRAEAVRSLLKSKGVDPDLLFVRGAGPLEPLKAEVSERDRSYNRRVSFTVGLIE